MINRTSLHVLPIELAANYSLGARRLQLISFSKFLVHNDVRWDDGRKSILSAWVDGHAAAKC